MRYPKTFLDKIKDSLPISQIVREKTKLEKAGKYHRGLCQFHQDSKPSMIVDDAKGSYHCFSCGAHGDVFSFVQGTQGLNFVEAIEQLAGKAGIDLPSLSPQQVQKFTEEDKILKLNEAAAQFFAQNLTRSTRVVNYLKARGLDRATCEKFKIGYALDSWDSLRNYLVSKGHTEQELVKAELLVKKENKSYDRFRDRIMFPIQASNGKVIAFGGRVLDKGEPKYLNSGETLVFNKSATLYGINNARNTIYKENKTLVTEGYTDVIALHQAGFNNAVAPLGTAFTQKHLQKIWSISDEAIMCLDGDEAGVKAMQRVADIALSNFQAGKSISFCLMPKGSDPDNLIKKEGAGAFKAILDNALVLSDFIFALAMQKYNPQNPEDFVAAEQNLVTTAKKLEDNDISQKFISYLKSRLNDYRYKNNRKNAYSGFKKQQMADLTTAKFSHLELQEIYLLGTVLYNEGIVNNAEVLDFFCENRFANQQIDTIRQRLIEICMDNQDVSVTSKEVEQLQKQFGDILEDGFYAKLVGGKISELFVKEEITISSWMDSIAKYKKVKLIKNLDIKNIGGIKDGSNFQESYELIQESRRAAKLEEEKLDD